jgi:hypothetical protein
VRLGYGFLYLFLTLLVFARNVPAMPGLWRAARDTALQPQASDPPEMAPP